MGRPSARITLAKARHTIALYGKAGVDPATPVIGMPASSEFQRSIRAGDTSVSFETLQREVLVVAESMLAADDSIGAIVCECTNLTPYSHAMNRRLRVPVFDMVTLVHWFHRSLRPERFAQD